MVDTRIHDLNTRRRFFVALQHTHTRGEQRGAGAMSSATDAFLGTAPFTYEDELAEAVHESLMTGFVPGYVKREAKEEEEEEELDNYDDGPPPWACAPKLTKTKVEEDGYESQLGDQPAASSGSSGSKGGFGKYGRSSWANHPTTVPYRTGAKGGKVGPPKRSGGAHATWMRQVYSLKNLLSKEELALWLRDNPHPGKPHSGKGGGAEAGKGTGAGQGKGGGAGAGKGGGGHKGGGGKGWTWPEWEADS